MIHKICHITTAHDSDDVRIFHKECAFLAQNSDWAVYLIAPGEDREEKGVRVLGLGKRPESRIKRFIFFTRKAYRMARALDADLYHFHDPELLKTGLKLHRAGKSVVFDSHEDTGRQISLKDYLPAFLRKPIAGMYRRFEAKVVKAIDGVVFPSLMEGKTPFDETARRLVIADNFPILEEFAGVRRAKEPAYDLCCTGSLTFDRGIRDLLVAAKKTKSTVCLAGRFSPPAFEEELKQDGLMGSHVDFRGLCDRKTVIDILANSRMLVSNIHAVGQYDASDDLPTKVYEAMAMALPVILSDFPYQVSLNEDVHFGLTVKGDDADALAEAISYLKANPLAAARMGKNGRRYVETECNWEKEVKKIDALYRDILEIGASV